MTRTIDWLERKFGDWAIPGLAIFLVAMNAAVGLLSAIKPEFPSRLALDPEAILHGEVWRLATFLFVPPALEPLWLLFWLVMILSILRALENTWGDFRFNLFCALGALFVGGYSLATGLEVSNSAIATSFFLAFSHLFPDVEVLVFFILPIKVRWLGRIAWASVIVQAVLGSMAFRGYLTASLANYAVFFGRDHWRDAKYWLRRKRHGY